MKITYFELLQMIKDGNPPKEVLYNNIWYTYSLSYGYIMMYGSEELRNTLNYTLSRTLTDQGFITSRCILYCVQILTEQEKSYLKNVVAPFRKDNNVQIAKLNAGEEAFIAISIDGRIMAFPVFEKGTMYKNMEFDKYYSLEELGI